MLRQLAGLYGIRTAYQDLNGRNIAASDESLMTVLRCLGSAIQRPQDIAAAVAQKKLQNWQQVLEPVSVVWENFTLAVDVHLPLKFLDAPVPIILTLENGVRKNFIWRIESSCISSTQAINGEQYAAARLNYPEHLPLGYHKLELELASQIHTSMIISAPLKACNPLPPHEKLWGLFSPLYALHTQNSFGAGNFADLGQLLQWLNTLGGRVVGTLPLLAGFFDKQYGPGPYLPASKLFWNEFYVNLEEPDSSLLDSLEALRNSARVDYDQELKVKRQALTSQAESFLASQPSEFTEFQIYCRENPELMTYAAFRAVGERYGLDWHRWPEPLNNGKIQPGDYDIASFNYYLYSQWLASGQIENLYSTAATKKQYLYTDLPVGVHPFSYDIWKEKEAFVAGISAGAPPDPLFSNGQNWNFPPLHPEGIRAQGYRYFIQSLRRQMRPGGMLRIDHIMQYHRLFWIPDGMQGQDGVYVNYHAEEMYAILALESCRNQTIIVGEDLGMVPPEVRPLMDKHGIWRTFVGQYELVNENNSANIPPHCVATLNTHDMFPFAAFWEEKDIDQRLKLNLLKATEVQIEIEQRRHSKRHLISLMEYNHLADEMALDTQDALQAILKYLAASPTQVLLINLEDLWLETHPQNVPGTFRKQNWSGKARLSIEQLKLSPHVVQLLQEINKTRMGESQTQ